MNGSQNIAHMASRALRDTQQQFQPASRPEASERTRKLFVVLQGAYGTPFLAKFSTGELNERREDKGMRAAQLVWDAALAGFADDVIEAAAKSIKRECPEFPPSLPQFEKVCEALTPRKTYAEEAGLLALPAPAFQRMEVPIKPHGDGKDWARKIMARSDAGDKTVSYRALKDAKEALGLNTRRQQEGAH